MHDGSVAISTSWSITPSSCVFTYAIDKSALAAIDAALTWDANTGTLTIDDTSNSVAAAVAVSAYDVVVTPSTPGGVAMDGTGTNYDRMLTLSITILNPCESPTIAATATDPDMFTHTQGTATATVDYTSQWSGIPTACWAAMTWTTNLASYPDIATSVTFDGATRVLTVDTTTNPSPNDPDTYTLQITPTSEGGTALAGITAVVRIIASCEDAYISITPTSLTDNKDSYTLSWGSKTIPTTWTVVPSSCRVTYAASIPTVIATPVTFDTFT